MEFYARFWLESIHYFVGPDPPVILVGTHKDKLDGDQQTQLEAKDKFFDQVRSIFDETDMIYHIQNEDFAVNNHDPSDTDFEELLLVILEKGFEIGKTSRIPVRWIALEKGLNQEKHKKIIPFTRVREINEHSEYPLNDDEELKLFLQYHHEKGTLIYFDEEQISDHVVLDPRYVVDAFRCIITTKLFRLKEPSTREAWRILTTEGKLTDMLIDKVWASSFIEHKTVLLAHLKKHNIISQVVEYDEKSGICNEQDWYVIPSLLRDHTANEDKSLRRFLAGKSQTQVRYLMQFDKPTVIQLVYHRLVATALGKWPVVCFGKRKLLFQNLCVLKLVGTYAGIAEMRNSSIELQVCNLASKQVDCSVPDSFRRFAESVVTHEFGKLKYQSDDKVKPFSRKYRCNHNVHGVAGSHSVNDISQLETEDVLCPDNYSHKTFECGTAIAEWFLGKQHKMTYPKTLLSDKTLSSLAQTAIGRNWEFLGLELGINQAVIDHIKADNDSEAMCIYKMLLKWKESAVQFGKDPTLDELSKTLQRCSKVFVDWDEMRNIRDTLQGNVMCEQQTDLKPNTTHTSQDAMTECTGKATEKQKPVEFLRGLQNQYVEDKPCIVMFECELSRATVVKWYCNNRPISSSPKYVIESQGKVHYLTVTDVCDSDEGKYCVRAEGQTSNGSLIIEDTDEEKALLKLAITEVQGFEVEVTDSDYARLFGIEGKMTLELGNNAITFEEPKSKSFRYKFPYTWIRRYERQDSEVFSFEIGRRCPKGDGWIMIETASAYAIYNIVIKRMHVSGKRKMPPVHLKEETPSQETKSDQLSVSSVGGEFPPPIKERQRDTIGQSTFVRNVVRKQPIKTNIPSFKKPMPLPKPIGLASKGKLRTSENESPDDEKKMPALLDNRNVKSKSYRTATDSGSSVNKLAQKVYPDIAEHVERVLGQNNVGKRIVTDEVKKWEMKTSAKYSKSDDV